MKIIAIILILVFGLAQGTQLNKPQGYGAARRLSGYPSPYIVGGELVQGREYPGQVSIQFFGMNSCGGSIINENYLLTAAHCCGHPADQFNVYSGSNNIYEGGDQHLVSEIHVHEDYQENKSWVNDIAVMKVDPPITFGESTAPVSLPAKGQEIPAGSVATVVGWGRLAEGGLPPLDLRKVNVEITDHESCNATYASEGLPIYDGQICAGTDDGNMGPCHGDSGGPLFIDGQVIGIVSWSRGCSEKGYPAVYTKVSDYTDWIESKVKG